jgi:hypothetical protein
MRITRRILHVLQKISNKTMYCANILASHKGGAIGRFNDMFLFALHVDGRFFKGGCATNETCVRIA